MKILVLCIANNDYIQGAELVQEGFKKHMTNPEGHDISYKIDVPNTDFDYLSFMNLNHAGTKISLSRFRYFDESEFDRIIYLDSDMEVVGNIDLLISDELNKLPFWTCHVHGYGNYYGARMSEHGLTNAQIINGGLQIINKPLLTKWFKELLVQNLRVGESFDGSDQGYISALWPKLGIKIGWLDDKYNYCLQDPYKPNCTDIRINHYTGVKLWEM
jgi:lipopolysaccharide biosynthesis glycosyltransferase